jgi:cytochrome c oxidase cbb3-type subunit 3
MSGRFLPWFTPLRATLAVVLASMAAMALLHEINDRADRAALLRADPAALLTDSHLSPIAMRRGQAVYSQTCASCHGESGKGDRSKGIPNLTDRDYLYGQGGVAEIERIVLHGIRSGDARGWNISSMPAFARRPSEVEAGLGPLSPADVRDVTQFLLSLQERRVGEDPVEPLMPSLREPAIDGDAANRGRVIFMTRGACYDCHGADAKGDAAIGGPNLSDDIWLYGDGTAASIFRSIERGRAGVCPAFGKSLDPGDARAVAAFVAAMPGPLEKKEQR